MHFDQVNLYFFQNLDLIRVGEGWFSDAMCVLADIVFYFVPEYLLGPRLVPMLITLLILAHMALPVFHGFSYYVVYSFFRIHIIDAYSEAARGGAPSAPSRSPGGAIDAPLLNNHHHPHQVLEVSAIKVFRS